MKQNKWILFSVWSLAGLYISGCKKTIQPSKNVFGDYKFIGTNKDDVIHASIRLHDGNFLIAGESNRDGSDDYDAWVVKCSETGQIIWDKMYKKNGNQSIGNLTETKDGHIFCTGATSGFNSLKPNTAYSQYSHFFSLYLSSDGTEVWNGYDNGGNGVNDGQGFYQDKSYSSCATDNLLVSAGFTDNIRRPKGYFIAKAYVLFKDYTGKNLCEGSLEANSDVTRFYGVKPVLNGFDFIVELDTAPTKLGLFFTSDATNLVQKKFTLKNFFSISENVYGISNIGWARLSNNNYVIAIRYQSQKFIEVIIISANGLLIDSYIINVNGFPRFNSMEVFGDHVFIAGSLQSAESAPTDFLVIQLNETGKLDWVNVSGTQANEEAVGVLQESNGNLLVTGNINQQSSSANDVILFSLKTQK